MYGRRMSAVFSISATFRICLRLVSGAIGISEERAYVDRSKSRTVPGGHVLVKGLDCIGAGKFTVLLVHVVCA